MGITIKAKQPAETIYSYIHFSWFRWKPLVELMKSLSPEFSAIKNFHPVKYNDDYINIDSQEAIEIANRLQHWRKTNRDGYSQKDIDHTAPELLLLKMMGKEKDINYYAPDYIIDVWVDFLKRSGGFVIR